MRTAPHGRLVSGGSGWSVWSSRGTSAPGMSCRATERSSWRKDTRARTAWTDARIDARTDHARTSGTSGDTPHRPRRQRRRSTTRGCERNGRRTESRPRDPSPPPPPPPTMTMTRTRGRGPFARTTRHGPRGPRFNPPVGGCHGTDRSSGATTASSNPYPRWTAGYRCSTAASPGPRSIRKRSRELQRTPENSRGRARAVALDVIQRRIYPAVPGTGPRAVRAPTTIGAGLFVPTRRRRRTRSTPPRTTATWTRFARRFTMRGRRIGRTGSTARTNAARSGVWTRAVTARCTSR